MSEERQPRCLLDPQNRVCLGNCDHLPVARRVDNAMGRLTPMIPTVAKIIVAAEIPIPHVGIEEMADAMRKDHLDPAQCQHVINGEINLNT